MKIRSKSGVILIFILLVFNIFVWLVFRKSNDILKVLFLDVGQGDSILIKSPNGKKVLIDGGRGKIVLNELGKNLGYFDRKIDVVIATHPDQDHIGGLPFVFDRYKVLNFIDSVSNSDTNSYESLMTRTKNENLKYFLGKRGMVVVLDQKRGIYLHVLYPNEDDFLIEETNDLSIVTKLVYGDTSFMLTGDAGKMPETMLYISDGNILKSNVLKAGHHGSKTSSGSSFVKSVDPDYAIISAGIDNSYGHPHEEVISLFENLKIKILETSKEGTISFYSNGIDLWVK